MMRLPASLTAALITVASCLYAHWPVQAITPCDSPVYCYGDLLDLVQRSQVFPDSKRFVDRPLKASPQDVLASFDAQKSSLASNVTLLREFVYNWTLEANSDLLQWTPDDWVKRPNFIAAIQDSNLRQWAYDLNGFWRELGRQVSASVDSSPDQHSLISTPHPFIVPGGRFGELYYWDTYWIIKGLLLCEMDQTAKNMVLNLVSLVEKYGMVPNGGRVYYSRRSQPPLLTQMVDLVYSSTRDEAFLRRTLPCLVTEYQFWMRDRLVQVGELTLNRYAVDVDTPRPESYREDLTTTQNIPTADRLQVYSNLASGAETGWDFSSRWLSGPSLSTIHTKSIVPVDLNAILCQNEGTLAKLYTVVGNTSGADLFKAARMARQRSFDSLFWNETQGLWLDWNMNTSRHSDFYTSSLVPLLWGCNLNTTRHKLVLAALRRLGLLDYPGGIPTSLKDSTQQWDYPNVWAPHQWFPVVAWQGSSEPELRNAASSIARTWILSAYKGWVDFNHTMFEKYNCTVPGQPGGGGEYEIQAGFGWTNGVTLHFLSLFPTISPVQSHTQNFSWLAPIILLIFACIMIVPCALLGRWIYRTGERRYWRRIHNEHIAVRGRRGSSSETEYTETLSDDERELVA